MPPATRGLWGGGAGRGARRKSRSVHIGRRGAAQRAFGGGQIHPQLGKMFLLIPAQHENLSGRIDAAEVSVKGGMAVTEPDQRQQVLDRFSRM